MSQADEILGFDDRQRVKVRAWGKTLYVGIMSGVDRDCYEKELYLAQKAGRPLENRHARLVVRSLFNDLDERVFTDAQADALGRKNASTLMRLFDLAESLNELGADDVDAAAKNS